jgi:hypothetical protein
METLKIIIEAAHKLEGQAQLAAKTTPNLPAKPEHPWEITNITDNRPPPAGMRWITNKWNRTNLYSIAKDPTAGITIGIPTDTDAHLPQYFHIDSSAIRQQLEPYLQSRWPTDMTSDWERNILAPYNQRTLNDFLTAAEHSQRQMEALAYRTLHDRSTIQLLQNIAITLTADIPIKKRVTLTCPNEIHDIAKLARIIIAAGGWVETEYDRDQSYPYDVTYTITEREQTITATIDGIGIFENIAKKFNLFTLREL